MSVHIDASTWRLQTAGGIPYKLKDGSPSGSFGIDNEIQLAETIIIRASDLMAFVAECIPYMDSWGDKAMSFEPGRGFPGVAGTTVKNVKFKSLVSSKPCDPLGQDSDAPDGTYCDFLELDVSYEPLAIDYSSGTPNPSNPETWLNVSANVGGELLTYKARSGVKYIASHEYTDATSKVEYAAGAEVPLTDMNDIPATKLLPTVEWNVSYPKVNWTKLPTILRMTRYLLGSVNSAVVPLFDNAAAETLLFMGVSIKKQFLVQSSTSGGYQLGATLQLDLKFIEKTITYATDPSMSESDAAKGHNHSYRHEYGWFDRIKIDGNDPYPQRNHNIMFT